MASKRDIIILDGGQLLKAGKQALLYGENKLVPKPNDLLAIDPDAPRRLRAIHRQSNESVFGKTLLGSLEATHDDSSRFPDERCSVTIEYGDDSGFNASLKRNVAELSGGTIAPSDFTSVNVLYPDWLIAKAVKEMEEDSHDGRGQALQKREDPELPRLQWVQIRQPEISATLREMTEVDFLTTLRGGRPDDVCLRGSLIAPVVNPRSSSAGFVRKWTVGLAHITAQLNNINDGYVKPPMENYPRIYNAGLTAGRMQAELLRNTTLTRSDKVAALTQLTSKANYTGGPNPNATFKQGFFKGMIKEDPRLLAVLVEQGLNVRAPGLLLKELGRQIDQAREWQERKGIDLNNVKIIGN